MVQDPWDQGLDLPARVEAEVGQPLAEPAVGLADVGMQALVLPPCLAGSDLRRRARPGIDLAVEGIVVERG